VSAGPRSVHVHGRPDSAGARPLPYRILGHHAARSLRPASAGEPVRTRVRYRRYGLTPLRKDEVRSVPAVLTRRFGSGLAGDGGTDQKPDLGNEPDLPPRRGRNRLAPGRPIKFGLAIGPAILLAVWIAASA